MQKDRKQDGNNSNKKKLQSSKSWLIYYSGVAWGNTQRNSRAGFPDVGNECEHEFPLWIVGLLASAIGKTGSNSNRSILHHRMGRSVNIEDETSVSDHRKADDEDADDIHDETCFHLSENKTAIATEPEQPARSN